MKENGKGKVSPPIYQIQNHYFLGFLIPVPLPPGHGRGRGRGRGRGKGREQKEQEKPSVGDEEEEDEDDDLPDSMSLSRAKWKVFFFSLYCFYCLSYLFSLRIMLIWIVLLPPGST